MLSVPKKANDAMHLSMLEGEQLTLLVIYVVLIFYYLEQIFRNLETL